MTNNDKIKTDATELLGKVINFRRNYDNLTSRNSSPIADFEKELRLILMVARTDEENDKQRQQDSYC